MTEQRTHELLEPVTIRRTTSECEEIGTATLDPSYFSVPENIPLVHQVITAQLAGRRAGTQSTKTRSEVRGGGAKPYRQKGTGNARQGSTRAPHYAGGGVALGPKPRDYSQRTPRKMVQQALRCALSDRARSGAVRLIDRWALESPKTKSAIAVLDALDCPGHVLVVIDRDAEVVERSVRNIPGVETVSTDQLTAYDVLAADVVVFTDETVPGVVTIAEGAKKAPARAAAKKAVATRPPARKAAAKATAARSADAEDDIDGEPDEEGEVE
jgi:large subunit ribosomal protein L4